MPNPQPVRGDRHPPLTADGVSIQVEKAWLRLRKWPDHMGPARVCITRHGRVLVGFEADRYSYAVDVGSFTKAIALKDLRDEVFHVWESLRR